VIARILAQMISVKEVSSERRGEGSPKDECFKRFMDIQKEKLRTEAKYTTAAKLKETTRAN
jgi:hypothetical protein